MPDKEEKGDKEAKGDKTSEDKKMADAKPRLIGSCHSYVIGENFEQYLKHVKIYFDMNKVEEPKFKLQLFMNLIGPAASGKIMQACQPKEFDEFTFDQIVEKGKRLFVGERTKMMEQYTFGLRSQHEGESISDFAVELQALAEHCKFGEFLDQALVQRLVCGLRNQQIIQKLLNVEDEKLTFEKVIAKAQKEEMAEKSAYVLVKQESSGAVNATRYNHINNDFANSSSRKQNHPRSRLGPAVSNNKHGHKKFLPKRKIENVKCFNCNKKGHYANDCNYKKSPAQKKKTNNHSVREKFGSYEGNTDSDDYTDNDEEFKVNHANLGESLSNAGMMLEQMNIDSKILKMEVDTGSCVSVCAKEDFELHFANKRLRKSSLPLTVVSGEALKVMGKILVKVFVKGKQFHVNLHVINSNKRFTPLLGRDWLNKILPNWRDSLRLNKIETSHLTEFRESFKTKIMKKYAKLFDNDMSLPINQFKVNVRMSDNAKPFVHKAYNLPFSVREEFIKQIDEMEKSGLIEKVEYSDWASPVVTVAKATDDLHAKKQIRICLDGSRTINPHIDTHHYPLPVIDELLANKSGAKYFCVLDLKGAYQQLIVDEETKTLLTINTIKGLYRYTRLPFGIKPAASIFQSVMDEILKNIQNVQAYIDDILCWASSIKELHEIIVKVLDRLMIFNVKVNGEKCHWFVNKVKYLGHILSEEGISANPKGIKAIIKAPEPMNVSEVRSFIGMAMYYSKFIPNLNVLLAPLYLLLKKDSKFIWSKDCKISFENCKKIISSTKVLIHYDPKKPIIITTDASDKGIGAVLSHRVDGCERPVFFISRTLSKAEQKYPILHREALGVVYAMERFYKYVYGHVVEIFTDHKPLIGIFGNKKGEPPIVATRLQRYIMRMSIFDYSLVHRKGSDIGHADCLSRLPIESDIYQDDLIESECFEIKSIMRGGPLTLNIKLIAEESHKDKLLNQVTQYVKHGWPAHGLAKELKPFFLKNESLSVEFGCLVDDGRLIIPETLRRATMEVLHANHMGIVRMKNVARKYVNWKGMTKDIEIFVNECNSCQVLRKDKPKKDYGKWPETSYPFERVHIDFFHFQGQEFLILIDVYSRWLEVRKMNRTNAQQLIKHLESVFGLFGYPKCLVSDNGPPFSSWEFKSYLNAHGIKKIFSPPYHPQSNGIIERAVQTVKSVLRKFIEDSQNQFQMDEALNKFLRNYRHLPSTEDRIIPAERIFNYQQRNIFKNFKLPNQSIEVNSNFKSNFNSKSKKSMLHDKPVSKVFKNKIIEFKPKEQVLYLSKLKGYTYSYQAIVIKKLSDYVYQIEVEGNYKNAHINQLRKSMIKPMFRSKIDDVESDKNFVSFPSLGSEEEASELVIPEAMAVVPDPIEEEEIFEDAQENVEQQRPRRNRVPTTQFIPTWTGQTYNYYN